MNGPRSILWLRDLALRPDGHAVTLGLEPGERLFVMGPAASGKSLLLRTLCGDEKPARGHCVATVELADANLPRVSPLMTPQTLVRRLRGRVSWSQIGEALIRCGLGDVGKKAISTLSPSQKAACEMLPFLASPPGVLVVDGLLDQLDPWVRPRVLEILDSFCAEGMALVVSTHDSNLPEPQDSLLVLQDLDVRYSGTVASLLDRTREIRVLVETDNHEAARAMLAPFQVRVEEHEGYTWLVADAGQETAARLVVEGYSDIQAVAVRTPKLSDVLKTLLRDI